MKKCVIVSDLHCGSIFGLLPGAFLNGEDKVVLQNPGQEYLWRCWEDFCHKSAMFQPDVVVVNGDLIDGQQRAQQGTELSLPLLGDQKEAALGCLRLLKSRCPNAKIFVVQGTEYHDSRAGEAVEDIAQILGAEKYYGVGTGRYAREVLWLDVEGVVICFAHHISVASGFYRLTPIDREMQWSAMSGKDSTKGVPKCDLDVRSHCHYFGEGGHASKQGFTTPCWELQTRFMRRHSVYRMLPDIGGIFLNIDGEAKKEGRRPCRYEPELYSLPPVPVTKL